MKSKKFDLISIGDSTTDVFLKLGEASVQCELKKENCRLCFSYADKVPVTRKTELLGVGNAANLAVGSVRLGLKTGLYTMLGDDNSGKETLMKFNEIGIAPDYIQLDKKRGTNYSVVLNYESERTILVFHEKRDYQLPKLAQTKWLYLTSVAPGHDKLHQQVVKYVKETETKLAFNPGTYQLARHLKGLKPVLKHTSVLFVNKEEALMLITEVTKDIKRILSSLRNEGPEIVVVTDGPKGSYAYDGKNYFFQEILAAPKIERTGCGDAFSTGFLSALIAGESVSEALRYGTVNSASVLQKIGAQEGLLTREEIEAQLKKNPKLEAKII